MTYINIHVIQSVPASCLNRDDTGSPKTLIFGNGGGLRSRLSSQSQKRAIKEKIRSGNGGRTALTKELPTLLAHAISDEPDAQSWDTVANALVTGLNLYKGGAKDAKAAYEKAVADGSRWTLGALYYVNLDDIDALGAALRENPVSFESGYEKDEANADVVYAIARIRSGVDPEIALYGRMVANDPSQNVDAAVQVAHAIGVSDAVPQFDFYSAKDDMRTEDNGAGMLGSIEFDAPTLYRYAVISTDDLAKNGIVGEVAERAIADFIQAFITTLPGGRQNSFAAHTRPEYVQITVADAPVNLSQSFMEPSRGDIVSESIEKITERRLEIESSYVPATANIVIAAEKYRGIIGDADYATILDAADKVLEAI